LHVDGIKAFSEPAVDGGEECIGFSPLALLPSDSPATRPCLAASSAGAYPPPLPPLSFCSLSACSTFSAVIGSVVMRTPTAS
jgi:hypothetical protein